MRNYKILLPSSFQFIGLFTALFCQGQQEMFSNPYFLHKPLIDSSVFDKWPAVEMPIPTSDASFALFNIRNQPAGSRTLVLKSVNSNWKKEFIGAKYGNFTFDNLWAVILNAGDSLCIISLKNDKTEYISSVRSFKLVKQGSNEWLCYQSKVVKDLTLRNLNSGEQKRYEDVLSYLFNDKVSVLLLQKQSELISKKTLLTWVNLADDKSIDIWRGGAAADFAFDKSGSQLAFVAIDQNLGKSVWLYRSGDNKAALIADNSSKGIDSNLSIDGILSPKQFSNAGDRLFIYLKEKPISKSGTKQAMVDVWGYEDIKLQSQQLAEYDKARRFAACICLKDNKVTRLQGDVPLFNMFSVPGQWNDTAVTAYSLGTNLERGWNNSARWSTYLIPFANDISEKLLFDFTDGYSPTGQYILGKGVDKEGNIYSYNRVTGIYKNLSSAITSIGDELYDSDFGYRSSKFDLGVAGWLPKDQGILLYDRHDIWVADLQGEKQPINITNGYGKKHHIKFSLIEVNENAIISTSKMVVKAFNYLTKEEGFYQIRVNKVADPVLLYMGPFKFEVPKNAFNINQTNLKKPVSLVKRESATEAPNYFLSTDFINFKAVTSVFPERNYNWVRSELHTWISSDGQPLQGILYKPENFDSTKKYPVLFFYYEIVSNELNSYAIPEAMEADLNVPLFVSNGYLIFKPDIHYKWGKVGESIKDCIVSAANYLSKLPFVDTNHMGLQGHSFGGYETNYVITQSHVFKAAMSGSGLSDCVSGYDNLVDWGASGQSMFEVGQLRAGAMLWEQPDVYIKNSPVFYAQKVSTPLLIMSNQGDQQVRFFHGLEFFTALRRLGKQAWMLQYDNGSHRLSNKNDKMDLTIRMKQFFDHYLKDSACPRWMLYGIPAKDKGIETGYELVKEKDPKTGKWVTPKEGGLLTDEEKKRVEALKHRKPIMITIE